MKKLQWDSFFFDKSIYEMNIEGNKIPDIPHEVDCIYVNVNKDVDFKIKNFTNTYTEKKIEFKKELIRNSEPTDNYISQITSIFQITDFINKLDRLYELAFISGENSRFLLDKKFGYQSFKKLYKKWIDNSINKTFADEVLVYTQNNRIDGFITISTINDTAKIGLFAVSRDNQRQGIGNKLLQAAEKYVVRQHKTHLIIPTQFSNQKACDFYIKNGYKINYTTYIKHYWRNDTI